MVSREGSKVKIATPATDEDDGALMGNGDNTDAPDGGEDAGLRDTKASKTHRAYTGPTNPKVTNLALS